MFASKHKILLKVCSSVIRKHYLNISCNIIKRKAGVLNHYKKVVPVLIGHTVELDTGKVLINVIIATAKHHLLPARSHTI